MKYSYTSAAWAFFGPVFHRCLGDLDHQVNLETNSPDLAQYLGANATGIATCSGFSEQDYPNTTPMEATLLNPHNCPQHLQNPKMPAELSDQLARTQCFSGVGILPALDDRAYLIVDSDLYLWLGFGADWGKL